MVSGKTKIKNPTGLHLRPAGLFCKTAMQFASKITVRKQARNEEITANAKSVLSVLGACIKSGDEIEVICEGSDETAALAEMIRIIEDGLGADLAAESNSWNRWDQTERLLWITPFMMQWKPDLIRLYL